MRTSALLSRPPEREPKTVTPPLLWALARALADGRAVALIGEPFECVELLANAAVRELVVVSPGADASAPAGTTPSGAPLRFRPALRERPGSKDLIVDSAGIAPSAAVMRALRKDGIYLTATPGPVLDGLPERREVRSRQGGAAGTTLYLASRQPLPEPPHALPTGMAWR